MGSMADLARRLELGTTGKVKLIVLLFVLIAICLAGMIDMQGSIFNGVRSYVRGEGLWAKAQKDAVLYLERYTYSHNEVDFNAFQKSLAVFEGDRAARHALESSPPDVESARLGFIEGNNAPEDVHSLIWFFRHFRSISYMHDAIVIWRQADTKMLELKAVGQSIHDDFAQGKMSAGKLAAYHSHLQQLSGRLAVMENTFSVVLGDGARWVKQTFWMASLAVLALSTGIGLLVSRQVIIGIGRNEQELKISEARFRSLRDSDTIGIASWSIDGRFTDANGMLLDMLGYSREELEDGAIDWMMMTPPEGLVRDQQALTELATQGYCEPYEKVLLRKDGTPLHVYVGAAMIAGERKNGIAYFLDISKRKKAEEALKLAAVVFDSSSNGVLVTDASMHILSVNAALCKITGFREDELIGQTPAVLRSGYTAPEQYHVVSQALRDKGQWHGDIVDRSKNGELLPLSVSISRVVGDDGYTTHYVAIMNDISERKAEEAHLWHIAHHDTLTGLPNRTLFNDRIDQLIKHSARNGSQFAVLFYDLDKFKPVNDDYGHEVGDKVLTTVAERLRLHVRETDTVTRLGGDEFVILLAEIASLDAARHLLDKTVASICEPCLIDGHTIKIGVSAGLSIYPDDGFDIQSLMKHADTQMYGMKQRAAATTG